MQLEPWVPPCELFDWWFTLWEIYGYWLVHIVVPPMGLQTHLAPRVHYLVPSLGTLCFTQWMAVCINFCICQALAETFRRQLYRAPISKHLLASIIVFGFGGCLWDGSQVRQSLDGPSFCLSSKLCNSFHGCFVPHSKKEWSIHTLVFLLLEFHVFCKLYLEYSKFLG